MHDISKEARQVVEDIMKKENVFKIHFRSCKLLLEMADIIDDLKKELSEIKSENTNLN